MGAAASATNLLLQVSNLLGVPRGIETSVTAVKGQRDCKRCLLLVRFCLALAQNEQSALPRCRAHGEASRPSSNISTCIGNARGHRAHDCR